MHRLFPLLLVALAACDRHGSHSPGSTVTVTLPPPQPVASPGFSSPVTGIRE